MQIQTYNQPGNLTTEIVTNTLDKLASEINKEAKLAEQHAMQAVNHALNAGRLLTEAKEQCPHGQWLSWIENNFEGSARTAQGYMRLFEHRDVLANTQRVALLSVREALKMLAEPQALAPVNSWLPKDEGTLALVHFADVRKVPQIVDGALEGYDEVHSILWIQRTPAKIIKDEMRDTAFYDYVLISPGNLCSYNKHPTEAWAACYLAMRSVSALVDNKGNRAELVPMKADKEQIIDALSPLAWEYHKDSTGMADSLRDICIDSARRASGLALPL
jgi:hypothetical protein